MLNLPHAESLLADPWPSSKMTFFAGEKEAFNLSRRIENATEIRRHQKPAGHKGGPERPQGVPKR
jgi:hypothetical protein